MSALASRALSGDGEALDALLCELRPMVVRVARLLAGSGSWIAEDAAQEALLDIARGIRGLKNPIAVEAWAYRVVVARVNKVLRREDAHRYSIVPELWQAAGETHESNIRAIAEAFYTLPVGLRAVAILRLYLGLSEAEAAEVLNCSIGTIKSQLHDARLRLATHLDASGIRPITRLEVSKDD